MGIEDLIQQLIKWMDANPGMAAFTTVAGLAAFMKTIGVPAIKLLAQKINKPVFGKSTVYIAIITSVALAEIAGISTDGIAGEVIIKSLGVGIMAAFTAIGIQDTTSAVKRPHKL